VEECEECEEFHFILRCLYMLNVSRYNKKYTECY